MMTIHVHWCPGHGSANEPHQRWWKLSKLSSVASSRVPQAVSTSLPDREGAARPRPGQVGALLSAAVARRPQVHLGLVTGELGESAVLVLDGEAKPLPLKHGGFPQVLHGQGQDCPQEPHNRVCFSGRPLTDRVTVQSCGSSPSATEQFLSTAGHHLLFAYDDDAGGGRCGCGRNDLWCGDHTPGQGHRDVVVRAGRCALRPQARSRYRAGPSLAALAKARGCYGMWVAVDVDNAAALATYRRAGAQDATACVVQSWDFVRS